MRLRPPAPALFPTCTLPKAFPPQGHFIEVQVTDGALYRTKIHCYFLDQTRVVRPPAGERNYHIFYQMLAGLTPDERSQLHLEGYSPQDLR